jgi:hypothetical protein
LQSLELQVANQAKIIHHQLSARYVEAEAKHTVEIKELKNEMMLKEEEKKTTTRVLGIHIGELEANIKSIAGQHDTVLEWGRIANQKLDTAKEIAKAMKTALEKKLKGESDYP